MRRILILGLALAVISPVAAQYESDSTEWKPQIGIWFGIVTPSPGSEIAKFVDTDLGGGMFLRSNFFPGLVPFRLKQELMWNYQYYSSKTPSGLELSPVIYSFVYTLPITLPVTFQSKAGGGTTWLRNEPERNENFHPVAYLGLEMFFPAGRLVNIGARIDYMFVYEKYLDPPEEFPDFKLVNGHFFNFGLALTFNLTR